MAARIVRSGLNLAGIAVVLVWLWVDPSWEPLSVLFFSLAYVFYDERGSAEQRQLEREHPEHFELVERFFWRGHVNVAGAPTQNELLLLLLSRHPKWSSRLYLRRSLKCRTQSLDDALEELRKSGQIIERFWFFTRLSELGVRMAREKVADYGF